MAELVRMRRLYGHPVLLIVVNTMLRAGANVLECFDEIEGKERAVQCCPLKQSENFRSVYANPVADSCCTRTYCCCASSDVIGR